MKKLISLLFFLFVTCYICQAQKYKEGVIEYGVISLKIHKGDIDSTMLSPIKSKFESEMKTTVFFSEDKVVHQKEGKRIVIDLESDSIYTFLNIANEPSFTLGKFELPMSSDESIITATEISEKIHGLNCTEVVLDMGHGHQKLILSKDIIIPDLYGFSPLGSENGIFVFTEMNNLGDEMTLTLGIKSFTPIIEDRSIFSIDTTGLVNLTEFIEVLGKELEKED